MGRVRLEASDIEPILRVATLRALRQRKESEGRASRNKRDATRSA